jgi:predicted metalloprotease
MRAPIALAAGALVLAVGAAGCGGGNDDKAKSKGPKATVVPAVSQVPRAGNAPSATKSPDGGVTALSRLPAVRRARGPAPRITGVEGVPIPQALDTVGNDVATFWLQQFNQARLKFEPAKQAILAGGATGISTQCAQNPPQAVSADKDGPFYCSRDNTVFLEVPFFEKEIVPDGDAATATVVAHEWGHRVEDQLGLFSDPRFNQGPRMELTADCLAGVWLASQFQRNALDPTDVQEALTALAKAGDNPGAPASADAHGTGAQRNAAFTKGYNDGRSGDCFSTSPA